MRLKFGQGIVLTIALLGLAAIGAGFWFVLRGEVAQAPDSIYPEKSERQKFHSEIVVPDLSSIEPSGKIEDTMKAAALEVTLESEALFKEQGNVSEFLKEDDELDQISIFYSQDHDF